MSTIIDGIICTVSGAELKELCRKRSEYHKNRAEYYLKQFQAIPEEDRSAPSGASNVKTPAQSMQDRFKTHDSESAELSFTAEHIKLDAEYRLDRQDLVRLGIASSSY